MKETLKAGLLYFVLGFAAGFVLGTIRTLWVVPRLGVRTAELMEACIMLGVSILAARWVVRHVAICSNAFPAARVASVASFQCLRKQRSSLMQHNILTPGSAHGSGLVSDFDQQYNRF